MELTVGAVVEGKVKSITNFGAFISLPDNKTGMVHISEVANAYVSDIRQHLTEGQDVKVMVIGMEGGKINLSIKRLEPKPQRDGNRSAYRGGNGGQRREGAPQNWERPQQQRTPMQPAAPKTADQLFEEKLKAFMTESDSKLSGIKQYADHRGSSRPRRRG
ncbi:MAG: S1 RNA-binding domain-containing protein [Eubacteriales bacterium]|nr:S1 RNA-binding domain-containing protein [Eubacteriales bacterium]